MAGPSNINYLMICKLTSYVSAPLKPSDFLRPQFHLFLRQPVEWLHYRSRQQRGSFPDKENGAPPHAVFSKFASMEIRYQIYITAFENLSFVFSLERLLSVFRQSLFSLRTVPTIPSKIHKCPLCECCLTPVCPLRQRFEHVLTNVAFRVVFLTRVTALCSKTLLLENKPSYHLTKHSLAKILHLQRFVLFLPVYYLHMIYKNTKSHFRFFN